MIKALLCDIDGTLVQSNWLHAQAWQEAFAVMNLHVELEDIRRQIGKGGDELIPVFVPWWKRDIVEEPLKTLRKYIMQHGLLQKIEPLPEVRAFIERVRQTGIKVALATSSEKDDLEVLKRVAHIDDLIDTQTTAEDAPHSKPRPDIFTVALSKVGLRPSECLALGDTPWDAESAGKAGIRTVGVTTGGWSKQELFDAGCIEAYDGVADLLAHFDQSAIMRTGLHG